MLSRVDQKFFFAVHLGLDKEGYLFYIASAIIIWRLSLSTVRVYKKEGYGVSGYFDLVAELLPPALAEDFTRALGASEGIRDTRISVLLLIAILMEIRKINSAVSVPVKE